MVENSTTFLKNYFSDGLERLNKFNIESAHQVFLFVVIMNLNTIHRDIKFSKVSDQKIYYVSYL